MKTKILFSLFLMISLAACGTQTPAPLPTVVLAGGNPAPLATDSARGGVTASGFVVSAQQAQLAFTLGGNVKTVSVAVGDQVKAGQALAELDNVLFQLEVDQARRNLRELTSPSAIAAAAQAIALAQQALKDAQDKADGLFYPRASDTLIDNTQGEIDLARQALARATDTYRQAARLPDGDPKKAAALVGMTNAQLALNALIAKYNWYSGTPTDIDAALVQANLDAAKAALQESQWYLSAIKGEQIPAEASGSQLSRLEQARDALKVAQVNLANTRLVSPLSGTVIAVNVIAGEYATPGRILFVVSDTTRLRVETTDLSERDIPRIALGQTVTVFIEALNANVTGRVTAISPTADTLGGDVVYKTTIELDEQPAGLRAGMSVEVQFETTP
jgi:multidrug efflux pump subunit AcrA (membrane-fusion protein)